MVRSRLYKNLKVKDSLRGQMMMISDASNKYSQTHILSKSLGQDIGSIWRKATSFCQRLFPFLKQSSNLKIFFTHRVNCVIIVTELILFSSIYLMLKIVRKAVWQKKYHSAPDTLKFFTVNLFNSYPCLNK